MGAAAEKELFASIESNNLARVKELIGKGVSPNCVSPTGWSALQAAATVKNKDMVHFLLKEGGDANHTNSSFGMTSLHRAVIMNGGLETIQCLVEEGKANVLKRLKDKRTILHLLAGNTGDYASDQDRIAVASYLFSKGLPTEEILARNERGETCKDVAQFNNHNALVAYLTKAAALASDASHPLPIVRPVSPNKMASGAPPELPARKDAPATHWTTTEVLTWASRAHPNHVTAFKSRPLTGVQLLNVTDPELSSMGISNVFARKLILQTVQALKPPGFVPEEEKRKSSAPMSPSFPSSPTPRKELRADMIVRTDTILGQGIGGIVYKGSYNSAPIAIKVIKTALTTAQEDFRHEVSMHESIFEHPGVVPYYGVCLDPPMICMHIMAQGSLESLLLEKKRYPIDPPVGEAAGEGEGDAASTQLLQNLKALLQILLGASAGVQHLHATGFVHRDIATRNFLLDDTNSARVCDFGLTRTMTNGLVVAGKDELIPIAWCAPEALLTKIYTPKTDVYSFGVMLSEVLARSTPFYGLNVKDIGDGIVDKHNPLKPSVPGHAPKELVVLMESCLSYSPDDRPTMKQVHDAIEAFETRVKHAATWTDIYTPFKQVGGNNKDPQGKGMGAFMYSYGYNSSHYDNAYRPFPGAS